MTTTEIPTAGLPKAFLICGPTSQIKHGVPAWWVYHHGDCYYDEIYVHTHDQRRGLAAVNAMIRDTDMRPGEVQAKVAETGWCRLVDECGCTPGQHAEHFDAEIGECVGCKHPDLRPCHSDSIVEWQVEKVEKGTPGALPYLRVELS